MKTQDNNDVLAYWLSNASTLLLLLQRTLKASGAAGAPQHRRTTSATLFGRMTQVINNSNKQKKQNLVFIYLFTFHFFFVELSWNPARCQHIYDRWGVRWCIWHFAASWSQIPCFAFQAAVNSICWKNIWDDTWQFEERDFPLAWIVHSGA